MIGINNTGDPKIDAKTDQIVDIVKEVVERIGPGSDAIYGMRIHAETARVIRSLDLPSIGAHGVEQSYSAGDLVRYGLSGSIPTDIILRDGRTEAAPIRAIWDIKTGSGSIGPSRAQAIRDAINFDKLTHVIEIHIVDGVGLNHL